MWLQCTRVSWLCKLYIRSAVFQYFDDFPQKSLRGCQSEWVGQAWTPAWGFGSETTSNQCSSDWLLYIRFRCGSFQDLYSVYFRSSKRCSPCPQKRQHHPVSAHEAANRVGFLSYPETLPSHCERIAPSLVKNWADWPSWRVYMCKQPLVNYLFVLLIAIRNVYVWESRFLAVRNNAMKRKYGAEYLERN